jgi:hypothetical protein
LEIYFNPTSLTKFSKRESARKLSKSGSAAIQSIHGLRPDTVKRLFSRKEVIFVSLKNMPVQSKSQLF